ncbi:hypothetical protein [Vulcanisaeta sp. JCM 16159]|uniref:hypothetical protein n=1 Tax=Vulcanisaeta sp. JCM 16159 TaxID=1295371 RepID=UPI001FB1ACCF|nr:hypothetical protein [Vulcanisaeta sp. JCM 16159]
MIYWNGTLVYNGYVIVGLDIPQYITAAISGLGSFVPLPPPVITKCWYFESGVFPTTYVLPNATEIPGTEILNYNISIISFINSWQNGTVVYETYEPGTTMYNWAWNQWLKFKNSTAYMEFLNWAVGEYGVIYGTPYMPLTNIVNNLYQLTSANIGPLVTKELIINLTALEPQPKARLGMWRYHQVLT